MDLMQRSGPRTRTTLETSYLFTMSLIWQDYPRALIRSMVIARLAGLE